jgi:hypothetical protein
VIDQPSIVARIVATTRNATRTIADLQRDCDAFGLAKDIAVAQSATIFGPVFWQGADAACVCLVEDKRAIFVVVHPSTKTGRVMTDERTRGAA